MSEKELAENYCKSVGDDCLTQRTQPGTPVGECIYCFCGCHIHDAFIAGRASVRDEVSELIVAVKRRLHSDDLCGHPFDEDLSQALQKLESAQKG